MTVPMCRTIKSQYIVSPALFYFLILPQYLIFLSWFNNPVTYHFRSHWSGKTYLRISKHKVILIFFFIIWKTVLSQRMNWSRLFYTQGIIFLNLSYVFLYSFCLVVIPCNTIYCFATWTALAVFVSSQFRTWLNWFLFWKVFLNFRQSELFLHSWILHYKLLA